MTWLRFLGIVSGSDAKDLADQNIPTESSNDADRAASMEDRLQSIGSSTKDLDLTVDIPELDK